MKYTAAIYAEMTAISTLIRNHRLALAVVCIATLILVIMESPSLRFISSEQRGLDALLYYGLIPLCCLMIFTKSFSPDKLGIGLGEYRFWIPASGIWLLLSLPLLLASTNDTNLSTFYSRPDVDWPKYILGMALYMLGWEYIFRGFLLCGLRKSLKEGAILVQMIPFTLLHLGKPDVETLSCILSGLGWGYICYRGRSFWPAFLLHCTINLANTFIANQ